MAGGKWGLPTAAICTVGSGEWQADASSCIGSEGGVGGWGGNCPQKPAAASAAGTLRGHMPPSAPTYMLPMVLTYKSPFILNRLFFQFPHFVTTTDVTSPLICWKI